MSIQTGLDQQYKISYNSEANLVEMIDSSTIKLKKTCNHHNYFLYRMRISIIGCDFFRQRL